VNENPGRSVAVLAGSVAMLLFLTAGTQNPAPRLPAPAPQLSEPAPLLLEPARPLSEQAPPVPELDPPVKITAGGEPIAVEIGHAAPFVWDLDRDGRKDLLVGQFGRGATSGRCRVYLNRGTDAEPRFDSFTFLQAAGQDASMEPG